MHNVPSTGATPAVEVINVHQRYGTFQVLDGIQLKFWPGESVALMGPSGCGKSTLLNLMAGLEAPSEGYVRVYGRRVTAPGPDRAVVFENATLLPWLSVRNNILEALYGAQPDLAPAAQKVRAGKMLRALGLWEWRNRKPGTLSGGQAQRVAIARAFAVMPRVLLLDEPFRALDPVTRSQLQQQLLTLLSRDDNPVASVVMVTHDIDEALLLCDRVVILSHTPGARALDEFAVDLPRPRLRDSLLRDPHAQALRQHLMTRLEQALGGQPCTLTAQD